MYRKTHVTWILLLFFLLSTVSPIAFGFNVDESEDTTYLYDWYLVTNNPLKNHSRKTIEYNLSSMKYQATDELNRYFVPPTIISIGGPIDSAWPMQSQNQNHTGLSPYNTASTPGIEIWRYKTEGAVDGGIAIDTDGTLYFGDFYGDIIALNPDGTLKWINTQGEPEPVLTSCPCIGMDGTIYVSAYGRKLFAINPDGSSKWSLNTGGNSGTSPAVGKDGTIYIGHHNNDVVAVNPNGTVKWKYTTGSWISCDPTIHPDGTIIIGSSDEYIYAINPNGTLRWKYKTDHIIRGHAAIDSNGVIWMSCWDGYLRAFNVDGTLLHEYTMPIPGGETIAIGLDGYLYVTHDGLAKINPSDGSTIWKFDYIEEDELAFLSSPAISSDGIIYIGTEIDGTKGGHIYAINPDGTLRWRKMICDDWIASSPSIADDGTIYIGSSSTDGLNDGFGNIHAFNEKEINLPPNPPIIEFEGITKKQFKSLPFSFRATDPDNSPLGFYVEWGDGSTIDWTGEYAPNEIEVFEHTYTQKGPFTIRAKARDIFGLESDWGYFELNMPVNYKYPGWQWFQSRFPILAIILNQFIEPLDY